jgi:pimeloyl-ACP methyl ester carboxylesterase
VNLPAHGGSDGRVTNMLETSRVLADLISSEAPVKGVIAHSFGGPATLLALRNQPQLPVERVATIGSPIDMDKVFSDFSKRFQLSPAAEKNMRERVDRIFGEPFMDLDLTAVAAALGARLLVVHDTEDMDVPVQEARTMAAGPGVQQMITEGFGHNRILRREPVVQRIVQHMTA